MIQKFGLETLCGVAKDIFLKVYLKRVSRKLNAMFVKKRLVKYVFSD